MHIHVALSYMHLLCKFKFRIRENGSPFFVYTCCHNNKLVFVLLPIVFVGIVRGPLSQINSSTLFSEQIYFKDLKIKWLSSRLCMMLGLVMNLTASLTHLSPPKVYFD